MIVFRFLLNYGALSPLLRSVRIQLEKNVQNLICGAACTEDGEEHSHKTTDQLFPDASMVLRSGLSGPPLNALMCSDVDRVQFFNKSRGSFPIPAFSAHSCRQNVVFKTSSVVRRVPRTVKSTLLKLRNNISQMQS